ncbi:hypothetical protein BC628DRAFT_1180466 [Trametes gibbosa]|nr:hypothetical protein BC628DRAFT_1180466 [Trametes gibbosa]
MPPHRQTSRNMILSHFIRSALLQVRNTKAERSFVPCRQRSAQSTRRSWVIPLTHRFSAFPSQLLILPTRVMRPGQPFKPQAAPPHRELFRQWREMTPAFPSGGKCFAFARRHIIPANGRSLRGAYASSETPRDDARRSASAQGSMRRRGVCVAHPQGGSRCVRAPTLGQFRLKRCGTRRIQNSITSPPLPRRRSARRSLHIAEPTSLEGGAVLNGGAKDSRQWPGMMDSASTPRADKARTECMLRCSSRITALRR